MGEGGGEWRINVSEEPDMINTTLASGRSVRQLIIGVSLFLAFQSSAWYACEGPCLRQGIWEHELNMNTAMSKKKTTNREFPG